MAAVLRDGRSVADLIDTERREISLRVLHDPELYQLELEKLWGKAWIVVGHETELKASGDFVVRYIGEDPVIVTRDRNEQIQILLNVCAHRGMQVCRAEGGRTHTFVCPYHGWAFDSQGHFLGGPLPKHQMHGDIAPKSALGLQRARVAIVHGLIFGTFDESAPSIETFLGPAKWYLDLIYGRTHAGMEVVGPPQRWIINGNWKLAAEQFVGGDGYHVMTLHRSMFEMAVIGRTDQITADAAPGADGYDISTNEGHSFRCVSTDFSPVFGNDRASGMTSRDKLLALPPPGMTPDLVAQCFERFDAGQLRVLADAPPTVGGLFPNVATFGFHMPSPDGPLSAVQGFHTFVPKGPGALEFWHWTLVEKDAPENVKTLVRQTTVQIVGATGMIEADDGECWPLMQRASQGVRGQQQTMKYHALVGINRPDDWPGGGHVSGGVSKDDGQWHWWKRYFEYLSDNAW